MERPSSPTPEVKLGRTFTASISVLIAGLALLLFATSGGQSFTTETLRRQQVSAHPQQVDAFAVTTASGEKTSLSALLANIGYRDSNEGGNKDGNTGGNTGGKVWLVDFVYTRCLTVCSSLGSIYQQLQADIEARGLQGKVGLLSISFDPASDDAAALAGYAARMRMNPAVWQIATLSNWSDRRRLLDAFGIMVVPAPLGEFEHNAALHVVTSDGQLIQIIDYLAYRSAVDQALASTLIAGQQNAMPGQPELRAAK